MADQSIHFHAFSNFFDSYLLIHIIRANGSNLYERLKDSGISTFISNVFLKLASILNINFTSGTFLNGEVVTTASVPEFLKDQTTMMGSKFDSFFAKNSFFKVTYLFILLYFY